MSKVIISSPETSTKARVKKGDALLPAIIEGISPEVTLTPVDAGVRMDVTTKSGTKTALIPKGQPGAAYELKPEDIQEIGGLFNDIKEDAEAARDAASGYATAAGQSATAAGNSASTASAQATLAGQARTGAETAQGAAEAAQEAAEAAQEAAEELKDDTQEIYEGAVSAITRMESLERDALQSKNDAEDAAESAEADFYRTDKARAEAEVAGEYDSASYVISKTRGTFVYAPDVTRTDSAGDQYTYKGNAKGNAEYALHEALLAKASATAAGQSATSAGQSATAAGQSATAAAGSAADAAQSAQDAEETVADVEEELDLVKSAIDDIYDGKETTVTTINKLDITKRTQGKNINSSGELVDNSDYDVTDFIQVVSGKSAVGFTGLNAAKTTRICLNMIVVGFYDSSKAFLSRNTSISANNVATLPIGTEYIRISNGKDYFTERQPMVEFVDSTEDISPVYVPYEEVVGRTKGLTELIEDVEDLESDYSELASEVESLGDEVSAFSESIAQNTSDIAEILGNSQTLDKLATFTNGGINSQTGAFNNYYVWRVATQNIVTITDSITVTIAEGFRLYVAHFINDSFDHAGWVESGTVLASGSKVRLMIARTTDDEIETANIETFCSKVTYVTDSGLTALREQVAENSTEIKNINSVINYGLTWDWWISANSVDRFGNVYVGYIDSEMYGGVLKRQPDGTMQYKRLERCYNDDDHNGMATIVLDDGKILVIGSYGHTVNNHIICWRSTAPYSIDEMEELSFDIPQSNYTYKTCYSQVFKYDGKLFDFIRFGSSSGSGYTYGFACLISSDDGDTWTAYKVFNETDAYNGMAHATDNEKYLKVVVADNPASGNNVFRGCYIDLSNYKIYNLSGTEIGEMVALNGGAITDESCAKKADMTQLIEQTVTGKKGRLFFVGKTPLAKTVFLYATATDSTDKDFTYKVYNDGTVTELGSSGIPFGNGHYISGACFGKTVDTVYYAKATTEKADGDHELHRVKVNNNAVASDEIITEASMCILRPLFLGNGELASVVGNYNDQNSDGTYNGSFTAWELKPLFTHA